MTHDYSVTFACYNSVEYTKKCIASLIESNTPLDKIVVVDNASTDTTREFLEKISLGARIYNKENLACGAAWNQGILHLQSEWTVVMNNDILVTPNWINDLIDSAITNNLKIVSPARIDGEADYDVQPTLKEFKKRMHNVIRTPYEDAVCMCIHKSVFFEIGYFRANPKLLGFEDAIFFNEIRKSRVKTGLSGDSWIHHFGSVTQKDMKKKLGIQDDKVLIKHKDRKLLNQTWLERKLVKYNLRKAQKESRENEFNKYGMTLLADRFAGQFNWK